MSCSFPPSTHAPAHHDALTPAVDVRPHDNPAAGVMVPPAAMTAVAPAVMTAMVPVTRTQRCRYSGLLGGGDFRHSGGSHRRQTCDGRSQHDAFHCCVPPLVTLRGGNDNRLNAVPHLAKRRSEES